jgi:hypothetical protein
MSSERVRCWTSSVTAALLAAALVGCGSAGDDFVLAIDATGLVEGVVYWDLNGTRELDQGDEPLGGVLVRLQVSQVGGTMAVAVSDPAGEFRMRDIPVGRYVVRVDTATLADTVQVVRIDTAVVRLDPGDTAAVAVAVSYPLVSIAAARALPLGEGVFIEGIALNDRSTFGDTTVHVADTSGAIRATRVRSAPLFAGDSVRFRGVIAARNGQPTLDDVTPFILAIAGVPPATDVTTAKAATADGGVVDAALVRVAGAIVADTATVDGDFLATVDDGSGAVDVVFDQDIGFDLGPYVPGAVLTVTGLLVPSAGGWWTVKPRSAMDVAVQ